MSKTADTFDLRTLRANPRNPQRTTPERLGRLRESLRDLPKMMRLRPLVYDPDTMTVLGGNKRLDALLDLGHTTVPREWVASAADLTADERRRFIIVDNVGFGTWDAEILQEDYTADELEAWGLEPDAWSDSDTEIDYSEKNQELDVGGFSDEMEMKFKFTKDDFMDIQERLNVVCSKQNVETKEEALKELLMFYERHGS